MVHQDGLEDLAGLVGSTLRPDGRCLPVTLLAYRQARLVRCHDGKIFDRSRHCSCIRRSEADVRRTHSHQGALGVGTARLVQMLQRRW